MSTSSESAEEIVRLSLEGMEVVAKISGVAVKNIAVALYTLSQDNQKTRGKARLNEMIKTDGELKIFSIKKEDLKIFYREAKSYGVLYCALVNRKNKDLDGMVDILVRAKDAPQVNRIVERYNLSTFNKASIETEIQKEEMQRQKANEEEINVIEEKNVKIDENMIDDILGKDTNENPKEAKTEKNPPLERSSMSKYNSERGADEPVKKESVKKKLENIKAEQKAESELKKAQPVKDIKATDKIVDKVAELPKIELKSNGRS